MRVLAVIGSVLLFAAAVSVNAQPAPTDPQCPSGTVSLVPTKSCTTSRSRGSDSEHNSECGRRAFCHKEGTGAGVCCQRSRSKPTGAHSERVPVPEDALCPTGSLSVVPAKTCTVASAHGSESTRHGSESTNNECGRRSFCHKEGTGVGTCCKRSRSRSHSMYKCPTVDPTITCEKPKSDKCQTDTDCGKRSKCCPGSCGLSCSQRRNRNRNGRKPHTPKP